MEWEKRGVIYLSLHCHHQNDSCIKMDSDESHFNTLLTARDKITRQCPQTITFLKREDSCSGIEPMSFCLSDQRLTAKPHRLSKGQATSCTAFIFPQVSRLRANATWEHVTLMSAVQDCLWMSLHVHAGLHGRERHGGR